MRTIYTLTIASIKMFARNKQALFFSLFMPLIILFIFGSINFDKPLQMRLGVVSHNPSANTKDFLDRMGKVDALTVENGTLDAELAELGAGNRTAVIDVPDDLLAGVTGGPPGELKVYINQGRPGEGQMALAVLQQVADKVSLKVAGAKPVFTVQEEQVSAHKARYIEFLLPGVIAMSVMQMCVFSVAFVFARYKEQGVLKRLMATPIKPYQFVTANIITRLIMAVAQAALFIGLGIWQFHVPVTGPFWVLGVCIVLGALMFLGLGFTISGLSKTVETVPVLANILVFPMMFLGNIFFAAASMPGWLQAVARYLPLTFFANALRGVITDGSGFWEVKGEMLGMAVWAVLLISLATVTFRFQEREGA